ncbi:MAG: preprotein translocase subunit SecE [Candidatus Eisenbacteria bacterium]
MSSVTTKPEAATSGNWISRLQVFLGDVKSEAKKVTWPSRDEVRDATIAVVIASALLAVFIFGVDQIMNFLIKAIL